MKRVENTKISYELDQQIGKFHTHTEGERREILALNLKKKMETYMNTHRKEREREMNTYKQIREPRQRDYAKILF